MSALEPFFEQSNWAWDTLPLILSLLALVWPSIWPAAIFAFAFSSFPSLVLLFLLLLLAVGVLRRGEAKLSQPTPARTWVQCGVLLGLALSWPIQIEGSWPNFAIAGLPFLMIIPLSTWMEKNSGGALFLAPCLMVGWCTIIFDGPILSDSSAMLACMLIYLMLLMAWYRQIPLTIKLLLLSTAMVASIWVLGQEFELLIVMLAFLGHKHFSKWLWANSFCSLNLGVWSLTALILLALFLAPTTPQVNVVHLLFAIALIFMGSQEVCRLCVASAKCREVVLSWWIANLPLLYLLLLIMGYQPGFEIYLLLCFAALAQEVNKSLSLKPIKFEDLADNECKEDFAVSMN